MAEKVRAIMTREKPRDLYDLWFLLKRGVAPDIGMINAKLKPYEKNYSKREFAKKVDLKKASWKTDLQGLVIGALVEFDKAREEVLKRF